MNLFNDLYSIVYKSLYLTLHIFSKLQLWKYSRYYYENTVKICEKLDCHFNYGLQI